METIKLNNGNEMPILGLGTFRAQGEQSYEAVKHALGIGYRHIDTAVIYANEEEVGRAIADSGVPRDEIFLTTKTWNTAHTKEAASQMLKESLSRLGTDYVDLLLVHWPGSYERNAAVWTALEEAADAGTAKSIGISNFSIHYVDALLASARIKPVINQVECHVELQNTRLHEHLSGLGIALEAYAPFMSQHISDLLANETLKEIASAHGKAVPQIVVRWMIQRGIVVIPKSVKPERIEENFAVFDFELSDEQMLSIRKLNRARRIFPEPDNVDFGFVQF